MIARNQIAVHRRKFLTGAAAGLGGLALGGCDRLSQSTDVKRVLSSAENLNLYVQRLLLTPGQLAREYSQADIARVFKPNGSINPADESYRAHVSNGFADWRLQVSGLVERPGVFSLADLKAMPPRTQITRHDCVEGWSAIGKWTGVPLAQVLMRAGLKPQARYLVFGCADTLDGARYYESIDLVDAIHPQTILAYDLNGESLPVANGAPLRLRLERQLGYKMTKYIMRIDAVDSFGSIDGGKGGFWEDRGYEWYAGI